MKPEQLSLYEWRRLAWHRARIEAASRFLKARNVNLFLRCLEVTRLDTHTKSRAQ